jgi:hypothetical protein
MKLPTSNLSEVHHDEIAAQAKGIKCAAFD